MSTNEPLVAHIGFAVQNLETALAFYRDVLGLEPAEPESVDGATIASLKLGEVEIELMQPSAPDGPIARFIEKRGPGIHHVCIRVPDLDAALANCRGAGYELVDDRPRTGVGGRRVAFLHPRSTSGILLELTD